MNDPTRRRFSARINRISGQVGGIGRMISEDAYCIDILTQIAAARSALDSLGVELLTTHVESCIVGHGTQSEHVCAKKMNEEELLAEVRASLNRFLR